MKIFILLIFVSISIVSHAACTNYAHDLPIQLYRNNQTSLVTLLPCNAKIINIHKNVSLGEAKGTLVFFKFNEKNYAWFEFKASKDGKYYVSNLDNTFFNKFTFTNTEVDHIDNILLIRLTLHLPSNNTYPKKRVIALRGSPLSTRCYWHEVNKKLRNIEDFQEAKKIVKRYMVNLPSFKYNSLYEMILNLPENYLEAVRFDKHQLWELISPHSEYTNIFDPKNGYLEINGGWDATLCYIKFVKFNRSNSSPILAIEQEFTMGITDVMFLTRINGKWKDISQDLINGFDKNKYYYELPRYGTTLNVYAYKVNEYDEYDIEVDKTTIIKKLYWNKHHFIE
ncbi:hypothetical protein [Zooshikella harenae]|uniref:SH3 domain-containing protein n=1 Tax=Zooshikella harenae TaxID=2827238 RepID=A0ABS5Z9U6_9GAMM|nr:hypothetical protein [Zooshikella harenae]MBU2710828.1 hypothetical protein [Zooshikella harenae]